MRELSNLLRQRLGAQNNAENGAGVHPDADALTAYSEQLLPAPERQQVTRHLASCADCREVLALSQAELPAAEMQPVLKPAPVPLWRKLLSPALGVVGVIAATALIAILITQSPNKPNQQANSEFKVATPASSGQQPASQPSASAAPETRTTADEAGAAVRERDRIARTNSTPVAGLAALGKPAQPPNKLASSKIVAPPSPALSDNLRKQDFVNNAFFEANEDMIANGQSGYEYPSAPGPKGTTSEARFGAKSPGQITIFSDIPSNAINDKSNVAILTPRPPQEHFGARLDKMVKQGARTVFHSPFHAPAIRSNSLASSAMLAAPKPEAGAVAAAPARADIDNFASGGAFTAPARRSLSSAETTAATWKVAEGKLLKAFGQSPWEEARTPAAFEFSFVSAHGGEVWAGGTNAGLIHSYDGGNTWTIAKLGEGASGSIVNIFFAGNHVQVKTSDDQLWSSADGGKSWVKN